ncbi:hypothetical protein [Microbacterium terricola]|uniref:Uncharacterized protein n=1 Tax=Microbacterium terricola TaxID=344163 RepID=A0ABM8E3A0_9MICO|nr:hypothetical protein [Microbacterium terricola]UYK40056.1 hypothetical protein OAU46_15425 [Microbacterium terricola]BDV32249.1 hypothetical protein Microterr_29090 [Microbacterium terricola]
MGTNRRYATQVDARMDQRIVERIAAAGPLDSLTTQELQLDQLPKTVDPDPREVLVWVRFGKTPIQVHALAVQWTPRAVGVTFEIAGTRHRTWVWASAVDATRSGE